MLFGGGGGFGGFGAGIHFEKIRRAQFPKKEWEKESGWPANNKPPYPPLGHRMMRGVLFYGAMIPIAAFLLQFLTPFPILTWIFGWPAANARPHGPSRQGGITICDQ